MINDTHFTGVGKVILNQLKVMCTVNYRIEYLHRSYKITVMAAIGTVGTLISNKWFQKESQIQSK